MVRQSAKKSPGRRVARAGKNSKSAEKIQIGLRRNLGSRRTLLVAGVSITALIIILTGITLFYKVYASPQRVFWDMISNNLSTRGFSKQSVRSTGTTISSEAIQVSFTPSLRVHDIKRVVNSANNTKITVDTIGTPTVDYQRYSNIDQPARAGKKPDYSKIYDMWLKNGGSDSATPQSVNTVIFGAALFGNLSPAQRDKLLTYLKSSYQINFNDVGRGKSGSRRTYVYQASIPLKLYAQGARLYAAAEGLSAANQINPASYNDAAQLKVKMTVDVLSRQLTRIEYLQQGVNEIYSGYGIEPKIDSPKHLVGVEEFNKVLSSINK
ncbi:MAG: hypothetical protein JWO96_475 [Candidatus Saccharibacteria bacterium]|nr:hypothetical protein [Candidatus Saccharibacteria bacterium]